MLILEIIELIPFLIFDTVSDDAITFCVYKKTLLFLATISVKRSCVS